MVTGRSSLALACELRKHRRDSDFAQLCSNSKLKATACDSIASCPCSPLPAIWDHCGRTSLGGPGGVAPAPAASNDVWLPATLGWVPELPLRLQSLRLLQIPDMFDVICKSTHVSSRSIFATSTSDGIPPAGRDGINFQKPASATPAATATMVTSKVCCQQLHAQVTAMLRLNRSRRGRTQI